MLRFKRFLKDLPLFIVWAVLAVILCSFVFLRLTDTSADKKIVVFVDVAPEGLKAAELAARLEEAMPEGIRMVQVRPFSYAFFSDSSLRAADIFIVKASDAPALSELFAQGTDGQGALIYEAAGKSGAAKTYITYDQAQIVTATDADGDTVSVGYADTDYYLYFNKNSVHTGEKDDGALDVAALLLSLP